MATSRARGLATAADIEDDRQEVVRGELVRKASPSFEHSATQHAMAVALGGFLGRARSGRPGGWWFGTEAEIELETHDVYLPDIAGWRIARLPDRPSGRPVRITPDWVCEVLSPSTMARDLGHKLRTYHRARVPHYWLVEPIGAVLSVYRWQDDGYLLVLSAGPDDVVRAEPFDAIDLNMSEIFDRPGEP
ncbi:MAG TPA: Uma2 family endonuclease [Haliangium sp.]|nr:Uma2 family endonuclease [Haliangium sp.]